MNELALQDVKCTTWVLERGHLCLRWLLPLRRLAERYVISKLTIISSHMHIYYTLLSSAVNSNNVSQL
jgi:hypothetical protein